MSSSGARQFFRPGYIANLIPSWIPSLTGVQDKLAAGAKVADLGCGLGASTILLAQEYPNSSFTGSDYHDASIELARKRAGDAGVADRVNFEVAQAAGFSGTGLRPGRDLRLPARHGRPDGSRPARPASAQAGRHLAGRRAGRCRRHGRQHEPGGRGLTTASPRCCACRTRCRSPVVTRSARRPARRPSGRSRPTRGSPDSAGRPRRRSTWSTRSGRSLAEKLTGRRKAVSEAPTAGLSCQETLASQLR